MPEDDLTPRRLLLSALDPEDVTFMFRMRLKIQELADDIARHGQDFPVVVRPMGGGYQLVCGFRRVAALRFLGEEEVLAVVRDLDDEAALRLAWSENEAREDYSDLDRAHAILKARRQGRTLAELEGLFGVRRSQLKRLEKLVALPEAVREALEAGQIMTTHAVVLGAAARKWPTFDLGRWLEQTISERPSVQVLKRRIEAEHRPGRRPLVRFAEEDGDVVHIGRRSVRPKALGPEGVAELMADLEGAMAFLRRYL